MGSRLNEIKGFYSHGIPSGFNYRLAANHCRAALLHSGRPALPLLHRALNLFSEPGADAHIDATAPFQPLFAHARPGTTGTADRGNVSLLFRHLFPTGGETRDPFLRGRSPAAKATVPRNGKRPRAEESRAAQEWLSERWAATRRQVKRAEARCGAFGLAHAGAQPPGEGWGFFGFLPPPIFF